MAWKSPYTDLSPLLEKSDHDDDDTKTLIDTAQNDHEGVGPDTPERDNINHETNNFQFPPGGDGTTVYESWTIAHHKKIPHKAASIEWLGIQWVSLVKWEPAYATAHQNTGFKEGELARDTAVAMYAQTGRWHSYHQDLERRRGKLDKVVRKKIYDLLVQKSSTALCRWDWRVVVLAEVPASMMTDGGTGCTKKRSPWWMKAKEPVTQYRLILCGIKF